MTLNGSRDWRLLHIAGTVKLLLSPGKAGSLPKRNYSIKRWDISDRPWWSRYSHGRARFLISVIEAPAPSMFMAQEWRKL